MLSSEQTGSTIAIKDSDGNTVYSAKAVRDAGYVIFSSAKLTEGSTYTLYVDNSSAGTAQAVTSTQGQQQPGGQPGGQPGQANGQQPGQPPAQPGGQPDTDNTQAALTQVKNSISDMSFKAVSSKTSKNNIKVTAKVDSEEIAAIEKLGYTVKYKYYRSTNKASSYSLKATKTAKSYINTSGKKGAKYYYKVRVAVYDSDGNLICQSALKQCRYACRTWTK